MRTYTQYALLNITVLSLSQNDRSLWSCFKDLGMMIVLCNRDTYFHGKKMWNMNISETTSASANEYVIFADFHIFHRMRPLQKLYSKKYLDLLSKVKHFKRKYLWNSES